MTWSPDELASLAAAGELRIAVPRRDGSVRPPVPIWVVTADGQVYVRTWHRRATGWYGAAVRSRRASIEVPGLAAEVAVTDVGDAATAPTDLTAAVDAAYHAKYAAGADSMVTPSARASTLRLDRA